MESTWAREKFTAYTLASTKTDNRSLCISKLTFAVISALFCFSLSAVPSSGEDAATEPAVPAALDFAITMIDGDEAHLSRYHGHVILVVNVASRCGLTKQYKQLQALHEKYADQGLVILGVPANNFGKQEPGTNEQIAEFCSTKFSVTFDMLAKVSVKGEDITPLYKYLTQKQPNPDFAGPIKWNFTKFLIDRQGTVIARFSPRTKPDAEPVIEKIEAALLEDEPKELCEDAVKWRDKTAEEAKSDE